MEENKDPTAIIEEFEKAKPYQASPEEQKLLASIEDRIRESENDRKTWHTLTQIFAPFLRGDQFIARNDFTGEIRSLRFSPEEQGQTYESKENELRPTQRVLAGKLSTVIPRFEGAPATNDILDIEGAKASEAFIDYIFEREDLKRFYLEMCEDMSAERAMFVAEVVWNPDRGRRFAYCESCQHEDPDTNLAGEECPQCAFEADEEAKAEEEKAAAEWEAAKNLAAIAGTEPPPEPETVFVDREMIPKMKEVRDGDAEMRLVDALNFFPEAGCTDPRKLRHYTIEETLPVTEIRQMFPEKAEFIGPDEGLMGSDVRNYDLTGIDGKGSYLKDYAKLRKTVHAPSEKFRNGRIIWSTGSMICKIEENPYFKKIYDELERLPIFAAGWHKLRESFWPESWLRHVVPIQQERNRLLSQLREQRELCNDPILLYSQQNDLDPDEVDRRNKQRRLMFNHMGGTPKYLEHYPFAEYTYNELNRMRESIHIQAHVTEHERGFSRSEQSGRYAAILQDQAMEPVKPILVRMHAEFREMILAYLYCCHSFYSPDRVFMITGKDRARQYKWRDLNLKPGFDIRLIEDDLLGRTKEVRFQKALNLVPVGYFNDPETGLLDKASFDKFAGIWNNSSAQSTASLERSEASQVPDAIKEHLQNPAEVPPPEIKPWHDAHIFCEELHIWLKSNHLSAQPELVSKVAEMWMLYGSTLISDEGVTPQNKGILPRDQVQNWNMQQQQMSQAQTGGPMEQGGQPGSAQASEADQMGEQSAMGGMPHES